MSENIFDKGENFARTQAYLDRFEKARNKGYKFNSNEIVDIDGLPTAVVVQAHPKPIDEIFRPDPDNKFFNAYFNEHDVVTDEAIEFFKKKPYVTSVDFNVSYPGYEQFDYHPMTKSGDLIDPRKKFVQERLDAWTRRSPEFAGSLKKRIKNVNRVFDDNPNWNDVFNDKATRFINDEVVDSPIRRINMTPEDSTNLSSRVTGDLSKMMKEAPEGTIFVNTPDSLSRGKLYKRGANFSEPDIAGNQFVVKGKRGTLIPLQITDSTKQLLGKPNFNTEASPLRTVKEMWNPDSIDEIRNLPKFQRSIYQKPTPKDLAHSVKRFAGTVDLPVKVPPISTKGLRVPGVGAGADVAIGGAFSYLTGETDNPAEAAWSGLTGIIPTADNTAGDEMVHIGNKSYVLDPRNNSMRNVNTGLNGPKMGLAYKNGEPVAVPYGSVAGKAPWWQPFADVGEQIKNTAIRRLQ